MRGQASRGVALHLNEVDLDDAPLVPFELEFHVTVPPDYSDIARFRRFFACEVPPDGP